MTTIHLATVNNQSTFEPRLKMLLEHDGRFFIGPVPSARQEKTQIETIRLLYDAYFSMENHGGQTIYLTPKPKKKNTTRQQRHTAATKKLREGQQELAEIHAELKAWREKIAAKAGPTYEKLESVAGYELEQLHQLITKAENLEIPLGYGQDE